MHQERNRDHGNNRSDLTQNITALIFRVKKITPGDTVEHCMSVENSVSKPINSPRLLVAINHSIDLRTAVKTEVTQAGDKGVDPGRILRSCLP